MLHRNGYAIGAGLVLTALLGGAPSSKAAPPKAPPESKPPATPPPGGGFPRPQPSTTTTSPSGPFDGTSFDPSNPEMSLPGAIQLSDLNPFDPANAMWAATPNAAPASPASTNLTDAGFSGPGWSESTGRVAGVPDLSNVFT